MTTAATVPFGTYAFAFIALIAFGVTQDCVD